MSSSLCGFQLLATETHSETLFLTHLSYYVCLDVRREIIRTVLCRIVY